MQQVIQTPVQQKNIRKLMEFYFEIEYKLEVANKVADALSWVHEDDETGSGGIKITQWSFGKGWTSSWFPSPFGTANL